MLTTELVESEGVPSDCHMAGGEISGYFRLTLTPGFR